MSLSKSQYQEFKLFRSFGVGPVIFTKLRNRYGCAKLAMDDFDNLNKQYKKRLKVASDRQIEQELNALEELGATLLHHEDPLFPDVLRHIHDCPPFLTVLGDVTCLNKKQVAIVGNRNASHAAMQFTQKIAAELCEQGLVVTSGLARGIDKAAHEGALKGVGKTVAVVAGGVDHIYPPEHKDLYQKIAESGAVVSEMPLGTAPTQNHFPRRNRLVSGMSLGVFVVEAAKKSGSLITARLAAEQGREVFAMPGSPVDARSSGPNYLLQNGATMVQCAADILDNLPKEVVGQAPAQQISLMAAMTKTEPESKPKQEPEVQGEVSGLTDAKPVTEDSSASLEMRLLDVLSTNATAVDDLIRLLNVAEADVLSALSDLELDGLVARDARGFVKL